MSLDERKKKILKAIINEYITNAEPIGSKIISSKSEINLSSATVRNEMSELENLGYLAQPHTSAGRIPSDKGYRFYVNQLMSISELNNEDISSIKKALEVRSGEMEKLIRNTSILLGKITKYATIAVTPEKNTSSIKAVQLVPLEPGKAMVIVVASAGVVRNSLIRINEDLQPDVLIKISNNFNEQYLGLTITEAKNFSKLDLSSKFGINIEILKQINLGIFDCISQMEFSEVYLEGAKNILEQPEYKDVEKAKDFMNLLDEKQFVMKLLESCSDDIEVKILIGHENTAEEIKDCSIITSKYCFGDIVVGTIGVIGPTRMDYARVVASMNYIKKRLDDEILRILTG